MKKRALLVLPFLLSTAGCSKLFIGYCDRVAQGTADQSWIADPITYTVPFSKSVYRAPQGGAPGAVCVTAQGETAELASGKNFLFELSDPSEAVLVKKAGKASAQPINNENELALWGGKNKTNQNKFESTECFNVAKLSPFVKVKVKKLSSGEVDEAKVWDNAAFCADRRKAG